MKTFFKRFLKKYKWGFLWFSVLRIFAFLQVLFWPYAFSNIINILIKNSNEWQQVLLWASAMVINEIAKDFIRLRSKLGLKKLGAKLQISFVAFLAKKTKLREGIKTGEAVQIIRQTYLTMEALINYYKNSLLKLPVSLIVIPIVLLKTSTDYFILIVIYAFLYLIINHFCTIIYAQKLHKHFKSEEAFWGTTYRKVPEVWREREDSLNFKENISKQAKELYRSMISLAETETTWWILVQILSSISLGIAILFVLFRIKNGTAPIGDLILVSSYLQQTQESLNVMTGITDRITRVRTSLKRLDDSVERKD